MNIENQQLRLISFSRYLEKTYRDSTHFLQKDAWSSGGVFSLHNDMSFVCQSYYRLRNMGSPWTFVLSLFYAQSI